LTKKLSSEVSVPDLYTLKQKIYQCEDSTILYQKTSYQVVFLMDENATRKIVNWEKETEYSEEEFEVLRGAADGSPSYLLTFSVDRDKVILTASKSFNYIFQGFFKGQEASNLIYLESTDCPQVVRELRLVVLKIEGEVHQSLVNWKNWIDEEAFTSRYTYEFYENLTFDQKYITVKDMTTGESLVLDNSLSLWR
jgi:hypothetical protein